MTDLQPFTQTTTLLPSRLSNPFDLELFLGTDGYHYALLQDKSNPYAVKINSRPFRHYLISTLSLQGTSMKPRELDDLVEQFKAFAETSGNQGQVFVRVAPYEDGIEIDIGDSAHTHYRVDSNGVSAIKDSTTILGRSPQSSDLPIPVLGNKDDVFRIRKYLNLNDANKMLLIAWLSYVLAHPKTETAKFPLLVLFGSQGYGKSFLTNLLLKLIDPGSYGLRVMPNTAKELAIMTNSSHVVAFDNIRYLSNALSDALCMASTGGNHTGRQLYTDADTNSIRLHAAIILNGIHAFINQPDLAQRCIQLDLLPIDQANRKSESELLAQLDEEMPYIFGGLLEYISAIFAALPKVEVINPERMIDFSRWLAAMEMVDNVPATVYQSLYSHTVEEGQLDVVQSSSLGDALYAFGMKQQVGSWVGTPQKLLETLNAAVSPETKRAPDWPKNAISLSKKIAGIKAPLETVGVIVEKGRGKERNYTVSLKEGVADIY